jgi:hypothetical protein
MIAGRPNVQLSMGGGRWYEDAHEATYATTRYVSLLTTMTGIGSCYMYRLSCSEGQTRDCM